MKILCVSIVLSFFCKFSSGATCVALSSGDWETIGTWSCGHVPTCGDSIIIPKTITVTITSQESYGCGTKMEDVVFGTLAFKTGDKLELPCGSAFYLEPGGTIDAGGGGGKSNLISICNTDYWTAGEGSISGPQCFNCVLPVRLVTFNAECNSSSIALNWETATETNNHYFSIERSDDGYSWVELTRVDGSGNSSQPHYYSWTDENPLPGTSYYRLEQTDYDGQTTYPGIIASSCSGTGVLSVYPNPSRSNVYCELRSSGTQVVSFQIIDELGQIITSYSENVGEGVTNEQLPVNNLKPGIYFLSIEFSNGSAPIHKSFVISH